MKSLTNKLLLSMKNDNKLNNYVINDIIAENKEDRLGYIEDVLRYGCQSGAVGGLIYYADTCKFYKTFINEINNLLKECILNISSNMSDIFGKKYDTEDPLNLETSNQNLLAWFGYEETLRNIAYQLEIDC